MPRRTPERRGNDDNSNLRLFVVLLVGSAFGGYFLLEALGMRFGTEAAGVGGLVLGAVVVTACSILSGVLAAARSAIRRRRQRLRSAATGRARRDLRGGERACDAARRPSRWRDGYGLAV